MFGLICPFHLQIVTLMQLFSTDAKRYIYLTQTQLCYRFDYHIPYTSLWRLISFLSVEINIFGYFIMQTMLEQIRAFILYSKLLTALWADNLA